VVTAPALKEAYWGLKGEGAFKRDNTGHVQRISVAEPGAAHAVLSAAGGKVETLEGKPLQYGKEDVLNPHFIASGDWY